MKVRMSVAQKYNTGKHLLRRPDPNRVLKYAQALKAGEEFPPIYLGEYQTDEGIQYIVVDGAHRLQAHKLIKAKSIDVVFERYVDEAHALADQLNRNMRHGLDLNDFERDQRIKLLANTYGWTLRQIGKEIGLHFTGVGRIIRGLSHGSKPGPKPGKKYTFTAPTPQKFIRIIKVADLTLTDDHRKSELLAALVSDNKPPEEVKVTISRIATTGRSLVELAREAKRVYAH